MQTVVDESMSDWFERDDYGFIIVIIVIIVC
jgi:hypothetical protein